MSSHENQKQNLAGVPGRNFESSNPTDYLWKSLTSKDENQPL
jgi:hypothetical protein